MAEEISPLAKYEKERDEAFEMLKASLDNRKNQAFDPTMLAMAQGFLAPTKTGSFGESLGAAAGNVLPIQKQQEEAAQANAKMRFELSKAQLEQKRGNVVQDLTGKLYKQVPTAGGETQMEFDPEAAAQLARVTGDPKYLQMAYDFDVKKRLQKAGQSVFTPEEVNGKTTYKFNPDSVFALAKASENPLETIAKYADLVPKLRKAGMLKDLQGDITTPFDAIVLMANSLGTTGPAFKAQAERLAKQYQTGMIDEDKANNLAKDMMTAINSSVDRQTAQENTRIMQDFQRTMAMQTADMTRQRLQERKDENEKKLSDEQKATLNKVVLPIINEGIKGNSALMQVESLRSKIENAPSGTLSGAYASSIGRLFGTDDNTALRELDALSKGLIPLIPRLPGSASNLDSNNLEKSLGKLSDITLTNNQRRVLVNEIYSSFKRLVDRAENVSSYWDANKKFDPKILNPAPPATGEQPTPASGRPTLRWNPTTKQFE